MKYSIPASFIAVIVILLFTISCNKNDISIVNSNNNATKEMLLSYLNQQKKIDLNTSLFIDTLISKSNWSSISETSISKDVKLIYVPLNYSRNRIGVSFLYNNNTQSVYYSLITETPLSLSSISPTKNPILNKPSDVILSRDVIRPIDVIAGFYKYNMNGYTGSIKAFSLSNSFLWEYGYQNGNRKYERYITNSNIVYESNKTSPKQSYSIGANLAKSSGCTMFYLVTYYDDGSIDINYLGERCDTDKSCQTTIGISEKSDIIKLNCGAPGGGRDGGGGSGNGDFDKIINDITDPCLKALITNLQNANKLTNVIGGILQNVFGENNNITLTFKQNDNLIDKYGQSENLGNGKYQVTLNGKELSGFSQERQTLTIMHEVLHSYFFYQNDYQYYTIIPNQHTEMLRYIEKMATSLENLYPNLIGQRDITLALVFDNLKTSVNSTNSLIDAFNNKQILSENFEFALEKYGFSPSKPFQNLALKAKYFDSEFGTNPCVLKIDNN